MGAESGAGATCDQLVSQLSAKGPVGTIEKSS